MGQMMLSAQPTPAMQGQEELAALFSRNLVLNPELQQAHQHPQQRPEVEQNQLSTPQTQDAAPIIYSISQHYHHSAHVPRQQSEQHPQRRASEPPQSEQESCKEELRRHGIDASALGPSQVQLFRTGAPEQKARLIELWKICPPANREENPALAFTSTTMEQEEQLARLQYERQQQQQQGCMNMDCGLQSADGRWDAEPYMQSGYEELMRREAEAEAQRHADMPKDVYSRFGVAIAGPRSQAAPSFSRATEPVYGVENRYIPQAGEGLVSWQGVSRIHAPAGTADAMEIL